MHIVYQMILSESNDLNALLSIAKPYMSIDKLLSDPTAGVFYRTLVDFVTKLKLAELLDKQHASTFFEQLLKIGSSSSSSSGLSAETSPFVLYNLVELVFRFEDVVSRDCDSLVKLIMAIGYGENLEFVYECIMEKYDAQRKVEFLWKFYTNCKPDQLKQLLTLFSVVFAQLSEPFLEQIDDWVRELDPEATFDDDVEQAVIEHLAKNLLLANLVSRDPQVRLLVARGLGLVSLVNSHMWSIFSDMFIKVRNVQFRIFIG